MKDPEIIKLDRQTNLNPPVSRINPLAIISLLINNWYYFIVLIVIGIVLARFYINHTLPTFRISSTILINEEEDRSSMNNDQLLQGLGLPGGLRKIDNQIMILKSWALTEKTLEKLPFEVDYYIRTLRNTISLYPNNPIEVVFDGEISLPRNNEFSFTYVGNNVFNLDSESEYFIFHKQAKFGETIEFSGKSFHIESRNVEWLNSNINMKLYFVINNRINLISHFNRRIEIDLLSKTGSMLRISMTGVNKAKDVVFINKLVEVFQEISLDKKNSEADRRIQFIDDQLIGISDSLLITENKLQQFRSSHRVMDLSAQGQAIIAQVTILENEKARLNLESDYYDYLANYLNKEVSSEAIIVPITMGISDPALTRLVEELANLQSQLSSRGAGEMNPLQNLMAERVRNTKNTLRESLDGLRRANSLAIAENQRQINRINNQASALPVTERQLLGIERKFKLNDELYTFLLEKRSEQLMQKASNMADSEIIDPADTNIYSVVSPNRPKVYFLGLIAGCGIPFVILFLTFLLDKKLKYEEIGEITDIPIIGTIPHNLDKNSTIIFDAPNSIISEAFRLLRTKMQFLTKEAKAPVILITSAQPGDGKTFTAINLASVYSLLGKKTILLGFDLRKPKIFDDFNLDNEKGISTWLIGKDKLEDIIKETSFDNLSIITAGPLPPNPSELISLDKTGELVRLLKKEYDYILIDSPPIGIVSDTFHLGSLADSCLIVARHKGTYRDMFKKTIDEIKVSGLNGVCLVINDIQSSNKQYGGAYGYSDEKKQIKSRFKKEK